MTAEFKDGAVILDEEERRSISSIVVRKPTDTELQSCRGCRIACIVTFFLVLIGLFVSSIVLIATTDKCNRRVVEPSHRGVVYDMRVKSVRNVINTLDYLQEIGVDTVKLSGVVDPRNFKSDVTIGTDEEFRDLFAALKSRHMFSAVAVQPAFVSVQSEWFTQAMKNASDPYYQWFCFTNDTTKTATPWFKRNGTIYHSVTGDREEASLNYDNKDVAEELTKALKYWQDLGADGFFLKSLSSMTFASKIESPDKKARGHLLEKIYTLVHYKQGGFVWADAINATDLFKSSASLQVDRVFTNIPPLRHVYARITSFIASVPVYGSLGWMLANATAAENKTQSFLALFSMLLPGKVILAAGSEKFDGRAIPGFTEVSQLRAGRDQFESPPQELKSVNGSDYFLAEMLYDGDLLVAANFGPNPAQKTYKGKVLFNSLQGGNSDETIKTLEPLQIVVLRATE